MDTYEINEYDYYLMSVVKERHSSLFPKCRSLIACIRHHQVPNKYWMYAHYDAKKKIWVVPKKQSSKIDSMYIRVSYVHKHLITIEEDSEDDDEESEEEPTYPKLPDPIDLEDEEMFRGEDGEPLEIRVVGKRDVLKCFFNVVDVGKAFGLKRLIEVITHSTSSHEASVHYQAFDLGPVNHDSSHVKSVVRDNRADTHYFTYRGLMKAAFSSRSADAEPFVIWATKTLFTAHLGEPAQKQALASVLTGISIEGIKNMCSATSGIISCIYLFELGTVKNLRRSMAIPKHYPDDHVVYKYGRTKNLDRRTKEHHKKYGKLKGANLIMKYHGVVDIQHAVKAERRIGSAMSLFDDGFSYEGSKELFIVSPKKLNKIKEQYDNIAEICMGRVREMTNALQAKDREIEELRKDKDHEIELLQRDVQSLQKEMEYRVTLLGKDNIILQLQLDAARNQH